MKLLPLVAFAVPFLWLYLLDPASFEMMWKGRTFQLFFIWLIGLELILGWENLKIRIQRLVSWRTLAFIIALVLPTVYVVVGEYGGLNDAITAWATASGIQWDTSMPLSTEYLVFTALFVAMVYLQFGFKGLRDFSVPVFFLGLVGFIYTVDNVMPYGQFTPFQFFVPATTTLAAFIMNLMGYSTSITYSQNPLEGSLPSLTIMNPNNLARPPTTFSIAWPCAGIESFLIFTVVTLLFLKRMPLSWKAKVGYFALGAAVTYVINAFRIVNIFMAGMAFGVNSSEVQMIHFYYGPLYAVAWIVSYPLIIIGTQSLWRHFKSKRGQLSTGQH
ncbi:MAG: exosortase/archaeosortase family protein [Candidatus Bathyarchaeia archaeon]